MTLVEPTLESKPSSPDMGMYLQGLREAGVKASQLTGATQPSSGTASSSNLGQMGTDTMKEFEVWLACLRPAERVPTQLHDASKAVFSLHIH